MNININKFWNGATVVSHKLTMDTVFAVAVGLLVFVAIFGSDLMVTAFALILGLGTVVARETQRS